MGGHEKIILPATIQSIRFHLFIHLWYFFWFCTNDLSKNNTFIRAGKETTLLKFLYLFCWIFKTNNNKKSNYWYIIFLWFIWSFYMFLWLHEIVKIQWIANIFVFLWEIIFGACANVQRIMVSSSKRCKDNIVVQQQLQWACRCNKLKNTSFWT